MPGGMVTLIEPNLFNPIGTVGRSLFPMETHTECERPFAPRELKRALAAGGFDVVIWETKILFAFAVSRAVRILQIPAKAAAALTPLVEGLEQLAMRMPAAKRLGWAICCLARKVGG